MVLALNIFLMNDLKSWAEQHKAT